MNPTQLLQAAGLDPAALTQGELEVRSPIDGRMLGRVTHPSRETIDTAIAAATEAFQHWRVIPAPTRGELVRRFGNAVRRHKDALGRLITLENGKILSEGLGEVQEIIDICDYATGLSRQLYGLTIASERPGHHMQERWHPLGPVAIITAFNFPMAVWAWNAALALVCGNPVLWKPSEKTPLTALALHRLFERVASDFPGAPTALSQLLLGRREAGEQLADDSRIPLVSATGSTRMGRELAPRVAQRFGRSLLELGGNNAAIVAPSADLDLAVRAIVFSAAGTAGQRCTTLRRLIVHEQVYDVLLERLRRAYLSLRVGNPLDAGTLVGPLIDTAAAQAMQHALNAAHTGGARIHGGQRVEVAGCAGGHYHAPALVELETQLDIARTETFAPILYVFRYRSLEEAMHLQNDVPQGLSSCIFSNDVRETEYFLSAAGSDCGIANVNIGPSGAEIGGAFGGEKETGGGRESGSDAWKAYMRRQTQTINYSRELPLAQGVRFEI